MLKSMYVDNYKRMVNFSINFESLTVLVGSNGMGKTSLVDVLYAIRRILSGDAKVTDPSVFPSSTLTRWQGRSIQVFVLKVDIGDEEIVEYRLEIEHDKEGRRARINKEILSVEGRPLFQFDAGKVQLYRDSDYSEGPSFGGDWSKSALAQVALHPRDSARLSRFREMFERMIICSVDPNSFEKETESEDSVPTRNASNFVAWYRSLVQERQDLIPMYMESVKDAIPGLTSLRLEKAGLDVRAMLAYFEEQGSAYSLRLDELSHGQRMLLFLYAVVHLTAEQNAILVLDEPVNFVALREVQPWLAVLSDACGNTIPQGILCSHHPEVIDYVGSEAGVLLQREASGVTIVKKLSEAVQSYDLRLSEVLARGWEE